MAIEFKKTEPKKKKRLQKKREIEGKRERRKKILGTRQQNEEEKQDIKPTQTNKVIHTYNDVTDMRAHISILLVFLLVFCPKFYYETVCTKVAIDASMFRRALRLPSCLTH